MTVMSYPTTSVVLTSEHSSTGQIETALVAHLHAAVLCECAHTATRSGGINSSCCSLFTHVAHCSVFCVVSLPRRAFAAVAITLLLVSTITSGASIDLPTPPQPSPTHNSGELHAHPLLWHTNLYERKTYNNHVDTLL